MSATRRIAIVINLDWTLKHHHEIFAGTQNYARQRGWECVIYPHSTEDLTTATGSKAYDGIIARVTPQLADQARQAGIPLVNIWVSTPASGVPTVAPDLPEAGRMAAEHLLARGFRRLAYLGFARARASGYLGSGFREVARREGLEYTRLLVNPSFSNSDRSWNLFRQRLKEWLGSCRPPVGVLAVNDKPARYVANAAAQLGLVVPGDVAIVGLANETVVCLNPEPTLTSIELGYQRVGRRAAELLEELMDGAPEPDEPILLPPTALVPRGSTDAFCVDDDVVAQALRFILEQSHRPIKVADVVDQAPLSWRSLERHFEKNRGRTIIQEITRLRIERVKRLLVETEMSVKQVATASGLANTRRLCEIFKRAEGISPGQYRRQHTHMFGQ
jgi:LacI family transcriptional regulator